MILLWLCTCLRTTQSNAHLKDARIAIKLCQLSVNSKSYFKALQAVVKGHFVQLLSKRRPYLMGSWNDHVKKIIHRWEVCICLTYIE